MFLCLQIEKDIRSESDDEVSDSPEEEQTYSSPVPLAQGEQGDHKSVPLINGVTQSEVRQRV